jgi:hypothetical protein
MPIMGTRRADFGETFTTLPTLFERAQKTAAEKPLESGVRPKMRNDRNLVVVWATLIGLVALAFWFKVPLA